MVVKSGARKLTYAVVGFMVFMFFVAVSLGANEIANQQLACADATGPVISAQDISLSYDGLTVKGAAMTADQASLAATIIGTVRQNGFDDRIAATVMSIAIVESGVSNPIGGDATSVGPFQQQEWWGTVDQRRDPIKSTTMVLFGGELGSNNYSEPGIVDIPGWKTMDPGDLAAEVQKPNALYIDRYKTYMPEAAKIVAAAQTLRPNDVEATSQYAQAAECDPIEQAVLAAIGREGDVDKWDSGAGLVSWAFSTAGISVPTTSQELEGFVTSEDGSVNGVWYPAETVASSGFHPQRGDLVFTAPGESAGPKSDDRVSLYVGTEMPHTGGIRTATYNVHGSSHTAASGSESGVSRIGEAARLILRQNIDLVGFQELQPDQRSRLMELLGDEYDIWPKNPHYTDRGKGAHSVNSIIWKTSVLERRPSGETSLPMPYYFGKIHRDIPLVLLRIVGTTTEFYVSNTHDPAFPPNKKKRWQNALQHDRDVTRLHASGVPVVMTGDFNSGYKAKKSGTYRNNRSYLAWCILGRGVMWDAYDASRPVPRQEACSQQTTDEVGVGRIDHVFATRDVGMSNYTVIKQGTASDHPVVYADLAFPGVEQDSEQKPPPEDSLGVVVGAQKRGGLVRLRYVQPQDIIGVLRLSISQKVDTTAVSFNGKVSMPVPKGSYVDRDNYGETGPAWEKYHTGDDYSAACGTSVFAATEGTVVIRTDQSWAGPWLVMVQTAPGEMTTWYAHMQAKYVNDGDHVLPGQKIGEVGEMGNAYGCHLHFEVHPHGGGYADDDIDPHKWFASSLMGMN